MTGLFRMRPEVDRSSLPAQKCIRLEINRGKPKLEVFEEICFWAPPSNQRLSHKSQLGASFWNSRKGHNEVFPHERCFEKFVFESPAVNRNRFNLARSIRNLGLAHRSPPLGSAIGFAYCSVIVSTLTV